MTLYSHSEVYVVRTSTYELWRWDTSQPITLRDKKNNVLFVMLHFQLFNYECSSVLLNVVCIIQELKRAEYLDPR